MIFYILEGTGTISCHLNHENMLKAYSEHRALPCGNFPFLSLLRIQKGSKGSSCMIGVNDYGAEDINEFEYIKELDIDENLIPECLYVRYYSSESYFYIHKEDFITDIFKIGMLVDPMPQKRELKDPHKKKKTKVTGRIVP